MGSSDRKERRDWRIIQEKMVLPVRIELTTSALPRMRSTTELRQHDHLPDSGAGLWKRAYGRSPCLLSRRLAHFDRKSLSARHEDRKSVVKGKRVVVAVNHGGPCIIKK